MAVNQRKGVDTTLGRLARQVVFAEDAIRAAIACLELRDPSGALAILKNAENKRRSAAEAEGRT